MYVGPDIVRPAPRATGGNRSTITAFSALICLGVILFLIAATIVLALIPIYTSTKSATLNRNARYSKPIRLIAVVTGNTNTGGKRAIGDLGTVVSAQLNSGGLQQIHDQLLPTIQAKGGQDLLVQSATIGYQNSGKKKRFTLSRKRRDTNYVLTILFQILFSTNCFAQCQDSQGASIRTGLNNLNGSSNITLNNVGLIGSSTIINLSVAAIQYVSEIVGGTSSATTGTIPVVYSSTISATTASATTTTARASTSVTASVNG